MFFFLILCIVTCNYVKTFLFLLLIFNTIYFSFRPTIKELLDHEFFAEDLGLKLEIVNRDAAVKSNSSKILFRLRVTDPNKRTKRYKENEAVQFEYDLKIDNAKEIAADMVSRIEQNKFILNVSCVLLASRSI